MSDQILREWAEDLPHPEAQLMLLHAAKDHPEQFTNHDEVGMGWNKILRENGFNSLCPYARAYVARRYLRMHETLNT